MEITYQLREPDLLALSEHHSSISLTIRRMRRVVLLSYAASWLASVGFIWLLTKDLAFVIALVIVAVIAAPFVPMAVRNSQRKAALRLYREGKNRAIFQRIILRVDRDKLATDAASGSGSVRWDYIERVDATNDHLFIYTGAMTALIVPRDGVIAGDFDSFANSVQKRWRDAVSAADFSDVASA